MKTITDLAGGQQTVELQADSLPAGVYMHILTVNGKEVVRERMVLTR